MLGVDAKVVSGGAEISVFISAECHKHMKGFETDSCAGHDLVRDILSRAKIPFHSLTVVTLSPHQHDKLEDQNQIHLKEPWVENAYSFTRTAAQISQQYPELLSTVTPSTKNEPVSAAFLDLTNTPSSQIKSSSLSSSPLVKAKDKQDASAASTGGVAIVSRLLIQQQQQQHHLPRRRSVMRHSSHLQQQHEPLIQQ